MGNPPITVFVAESNQMGSQLMASAFKGAGQRLHVEVTATDSDTVLSSLGKKPPQVAVISAHLQDGPLMGLKVLRQLRAAQQRIPTVVLLDSSDRDLVIECFRSGARGVFCRSKPFEALCKCIHVVFQGQIWADTSELQYVLEGLAEMARLPVVQNRGSVKLTKRESEVVCLVSDGLTNRLVAEQLGLSEHTVRNYLFRIFDKIGVSSRVELVRYYIDQVLRSQAELRGEATS